MTDRSVGSRWPIIY
ncbi:hypothetical protein PENARI_c036G12064 [Penicillium arizonense]|uniref:Uncharacterized protein n=1 Tax=Penicillium arizonense TaxID=1835702 RepID=A0A1F5L3L5_PENAI|nr:hypothetical protein PENARI_c036G12064 [Penicillium arizonense]